MLYKRRQVSLNRIQMPFSPETLERFLCWNRMTMRRGKGHLTTNIIARFASDWKTVRVADEFQPEVYDARTAL